MTLAKTKHPGGRPPLPEGAARDVQVQTRLERELAEKLDRLVARAQSQTPAATVTRSSLLRSWVQQAPDVDA